MVFLSEMKCILFHSIITKQHPKRNARRFVSKSFSIVLAKTVMFDNVSIKLLFLYYATTKIVWNPTSNTK